MESGREDRKHQVRAGGTRVSVVEASMESGREDRKHGSPNSTPVTCEGTGLCEWWQAATNITRQVCLFHPCDTTSDLRASGPRGLTHR